jgi:hypothetical protein
MAHRDILLAGAAGNTPDANLDGRLNRALLIVLADRLGAFDDEGNIVGIERHMITPDARYNGRPLRAYIGHEPSKVREMAGSDEEAGRIFLALGITPAQAEESFRAQDEAERAASEDEEKGAGHPEVATGSTEGDLQAQAVVASSASTPTQAATEPVASTGLAAFRAAQAARAQGGEGDTGGNAPGGSQEPQGGAEATAANDPAATPATGSGSGPEATDPKAAKAAAKATPPATT